MSEQGKSDHWANLASLLGTAPPPEEQEQKQEPSRPEEIQPEGIAAEETEPKAPVGTEAKARYAAPKLHRTAQDWSQLATSLGIVVETEVEPAPQSAEATTSTEVVEPTAPEELPPALPAVVIESSAAEVDVVDVFSDSDTPVTDNLVEHVDTGSEAGERPERRRRRKRRRRRSRRESEAEVQEGAAEAPESVGEAEEPEEVDARASESVIVSPLSSVPAETPSRKRRRRRRRGEKKRSEAEPGESLAECLAELEGPSEGGLGEALEEDAGIKPSAESALADEGEHGEESLDEDGERLVHRGIPTWEETVSVVVDRNLESRAKSPGGPPRGRGHKGRG
jgi:ribonuclease E